MPEISDSHSPTEDGAKKEPEIIAWRKYNNGKLEEASYADNHSTAIQQIFTPISPRRVVYSSFFDGDHSIGETPGKTKNVSSLSKFERDLLKLSEKTFIKKYPNVALHETRKRTVQVGERTIERID